MENPMRVAELLEALEGLDPDAEVRVAYQPQYPIWFPVGGLSVVTPTDPENEDDFQPDDEPGTVYLLQDQWASGGYAASAVFNEWAVD